MRQEFPGQTTDPPLIFLLASLEERKQYAEGKFYKLINAFDSDAEEIAVTDANRSVIWRSD